MVGSWMPGDEIRVKASIALDPPDPTLLPKLMARIAYTDDSGAVVPVGSGTFDVATGIASMATTVFPGAPERFFYVLAWIDSTGTGVFDPTKPYRDTNGAFYIRAIPSFTSNASFIFLKTLAGTWWTTQWKWASRFMNAFLDDAPITDVTQVLTRVITNRTPRLTHNTGAVWDTAGNAQVRLNRFATDSPLAEKVRTSNAFKAKLMDTLTRGKAKVNAYSWGSETEHTFTFTITPDIAFTGTGPLEDTDLHYAIGSAELVRCKLYARVRKSDLELIGLDLVGKLNDLYDFDYNNTSNWFPFVRQAAEVQASYYPPAGQPHGAIYETDIELSKANLDIHFNFK